MIHLASETLITALETAYHARHPGTAAVNFDLDLPTTAGPTAVISLFLYRVEVDGTRRHREIAPAVPGQPTRWSLSLDLHYLLAVSARHPRIQQQHLARAMALLDELAIVQGPQLARPPGWTVGVDPDPWLPGAALKVAVADLSHEDLLRLWDGIEPRYRVSVPYVVRTLQLRPVEGANDTLADHRVHVLTRRSVGEGT